MEQIKSIVLLSSQANSLVNFRGDLIKRIHLLGIRVYALAPDFDEVTRKKLLSLGAEPLDISLSRTGMNPVRDLIDCLRLACVLRRLRPDRVLAYFIKPVIYGNLAAWVAKVPYRVGMIEGLGYVFTETGQVLSAKRRAVRTVVQWLYRISLSVAHRVVFLNPDDRNEFVETRLVDSSKTEVLGGIGVDLQEWYFAPASVEPITFVLIARLLREKGVMEYVEAARLVKAKWPKVRFLLLGGLDENPGAISQKDVQQWVARGILEWPGHVPVRDYLLQASVFVLPSYREGVPRSTQEAMAMGRAILTTDVPGCRETVKDGKNGFLVPVRDVKALADKMEKLIETPALIQEMGVESRRMAEEKFDVHRINERLIGILRLAR